MHEGWWVLFLNIKLIIIIKLFINNNKIYIAQIKIWIYDQMHIKIKSENLPCDVYGYFLEQHNVFQYNETCIKRTPASVKTNISSLILC